ncbi:hypothetical protein [Paractinoplanes globisporus]|uniref:ABM domain-containing protein n=1 Tax=Paractinoplanes globisporus TaxID=113565 RepID=A0ABW6WRK4_9ACTN|nr:hypothetical protein [Actinoplanes globisporus]
MRTLGQDSFKGQNWLITPAALQVDEPRPASVYDQRWLLVLTGVVESDLEGDSPHQWLHETLSFIPDLDGPLNFAIDRYSIPRPPGSTSVFFMAEQWAPAASLASIFDQDTSDNAGFAVDLWRPAHFSQVMDIVTGQLAGNIFTGINVDVAVRDSDAWLYRLGYHITLLGKIVFANLFHG